MRNSISFALRMRTNSTLVPKRNIGSTLMIAPSCCQVIPWLLKSAVSTKVTKCGLPTFTIAPSMTVLTPSMPIARRMTRGTPMPLSIHHVAPSRLSTRQVRLPPCVSKTISVRPSLWASHVATQRVPLPLSSASLPSALKSRRKNVPSGLRSRNSMPSAPTPVCRSHNLFASAACLPAVALSSITRKSLPQACAFTNRSELVRLQLSEHLRVLAPRRHHGKTDALPPGDVIALENTQALSGRVEHLQDRGHHAEACGIDGLRELVGALHTDYILADNGADLGAHLIEHREALPSKAAFHRADKLQCDQQKNGREQSIHIHAGAARHADRGHDEHSRRARKPEHAALRMQDQSCAKEAYALHNVRRHLALVRR